MVVAGAGLLIGSVVAAYASSVSTEQPELQTSLAKKDDETKSKKKLQRRNTIKLDSNGENFNKETEKNNGYTSLSHRVNNKQSK
jgi:hypothetical protein